MQIKLMYKFRSYGYEYGSLPDKYGQGYLWWTRQNDDLIRKLVIISILFAVGVSYRSYMR